MIKPAITVNRICSLTEILEELKKGKPPIPQQLLNSLIVLVKVQNNDLLFKPETIEK